MKKSTIMLIVLILTLLISPVRNGHKYNPLFYELGKYVFAEEIPIVRFSIPIKALPPCFRANPRSKCKDLIVSESTNLLSEQDDKLYMVIYDYNSFDNKIKGAHLVKKIKFALWKVNNHIDIFNKIIFELNKIDPIMENDTKLSKDEYILTVFKGGTDPDSDGFHSLETGSITDAIIEKVSYEEAKERYKNLITRPTFFKAKKLYVKLFVYGVNKEKYIIKDSFGNILIWAGERE